MNMRHTTILVLAGLLGACGDTPSPEQTSKGSTVLSADSVLPAGQTKGLSRGTGDALYGFDRINQQRDVIFKQPVSIAATEPLVFAGWAVDRTQSRLATGVDVLIDGKPYAADYGGAREDIASYLKTPGYRDCGFRLSVPAKVIGAGRHEVAIRVIGANGTMYWEGAKVVLNVN